MAGLTRPGWGEQASSLASGYLAGATAYLKAVADSDPSLTPAQLLARPDVAAYLGEQLHEAQRAVLEVLSMSWAHDNGGDEHVTVYNHLAHDITRSYGTVASVQKVLRESREPPWEALEALARKVALRNAMSVDYGSRYSGFAASIAAAPHGSMKRWMAKVGSPTCCHWCRKLHGVTIPLHADFNPYIGGPVELPTGRFLQPPKAYLGRLQSPPLHPHCRCDLAFVHAAAGAVTSGEANGDHFPFISSSDIQSMPEAKYELLTEFLRAASHELGTVLRRLASEPRG
jgi:hypothetical protein